MIFPKIGSLYKRKGGGGGGGGGGAGGGHASGGHSSGEGDGSTGSKGGSATEHGASTSFTSSRGASAFSLSSSGLGKTTASAYSDGGGKPSTLGSSSPFSGRLTGGGGRSGVYGTFRFGSGYPYGGYGQYVDSRPFPYGFYPVPVAVGYYGGNEYLNVSSSARPGGNLVSAIVQPSWNTSNVTYRIVGDNTSVIAVFDALVVNCSVANSSSAISAFSPSPSTWPLPEQIVQYYRASTFALSLDGYNNSASLQSNMPASNTSAPDSIADTPLPSNLNNTFLQCVNFTTGASVPLVDVTSNALTGTLIGLIVVFSLFGGLSLLVCMCICCSRCCSGRSERKPKKGLADKRRLSFEEEFYSRTPKISILAPEEIIKMRPNYSGIESRPIPSATRDGQSSLTPMKLNERKYLSLSPPQSPRSRSEERTLIDGQPKTADTLVFAMEKGAH
ncbi:hypothetical protein EW145_g5509 [Phellinidium pouzarii]|uniref:Uncharacterized protein n=1 Tax=Phellinidium pouzarii TaxID=167371 RepID=A0A4S4L1K8_9AGAM|nr:hypothetical protein EW145_g5509 [Phellinidium pouzarii]